MRRVLQSRKFFEGFTARATHWSIGFLLGAMAKNNSKKGTSQIKRRMMDKVLGTMKMDKFSFLGTMKMDKVCFLGTMKMDKICFLSKR